MPTGGYRGLGDLAQIVETYCEDDDPAHETAPRSPDLITHVAVHKMTVHDGHRLPNALDDLADRSLTPKVLLADSHYGSADNMTLTQMRSIVLTAPGTGGQRKLFRALDPGKLQP